MDKNELIALTLKKLIEHFKGSPESFEYHDQDRKPNTASQPTIYWQPKVQLNDYMSTVVQDPNNCHAVVVTFNNHLNELTCYLYLKAPKNLSGNYGGMSPDCVITSRRWFERWRGHYSRFCRLRELILDRDKQKENLNYLNKLASVFPDAVDDHIID